MCSSQSSYRHNFYAAALLLTNKSLFTSYTAVTPHITAHFYVEHITSCNGELPSTVTVSNTSFTPHYSVRGKGSVANEVRLVGKKKFA